MFHLRKLLIYERSKRLKTSSVTFVCNIYSYYIHRETNKFGLGAIRFLLIVFLGPPFSICFSWDASRLLTLFSRYLDYPLILQLIQLCFIIYRCPVENMQ